MGTEWSDRKCQDGIPRNGTKKGDLARTGIDRGCSAPVAKMAGSQDFAWTGFDRGGLVLKIPQRKRKMPRTGFLLERQVKAALSGDRGLETQKGRLKRGPWVQDYNS